MHKISIFLIAIASCIFVKHAHASDLNKPLITFQDQLISLQKALTPHTVTLEQIEKIEEIKEQIRKEPVHRQELTEALKKVNPETLQEWIYSFYKQNTLDSVNKKFSKVFKKKLRKASLLDTVKTNIDKYINFLAHEKAEKQYSDENKAIEHERQRLLQSLSDEKGKEKEKIEQRLTEIGSQRLKGVHEIAQEEKKAITSLLILLGNNPTLWKKIKPYLPHMIGAGTLVTAVLLYYYGINPPASLIALPGVLTTRDQSGTKLEVAVRNNDIKQVEKLCSSNQYKAKHITKMRIKKRSQKLKKMRAKIEEKKTKNRDKRLLRPPSLIQEKLQKKRIDLELIRKFMTS